MFETSEIFNVSVTNCPILSGFWNFVVSVF